jgi:uncharacterized protein (TIGR00369 family)
MTTDTHPQSKAKFGQRDPTQAGNHFRQLLGYTTKVWREGYGEVALILREDHMNSMGIVHGGVYVTLLDAAFGHACAWCASDGHVRSAVTVSLTTTYLAPSRTGVLVARGQIAGQSGRLVTLTGDVIDSAGVTCALGQASFMYMPGSEHRDGVPRS